METPDAAVDPHARFQPDPARLASLRLLLQQTDGTLSYEQVALALRLQPPCTIRQVIAALEQLMVDDAAAGRPLLAARVISRNRGGLPAPGFFDLAERLGRYQGPLQGEAAAHFHQSELARLSKSLG